MLFWFKKILSAVGWVLVGMCIYAYIVLPFDWVQTLQLFVACLGAALIGVFADLGAFDEFYEMTIAEEEDEEDLEQ